MAFDPDAYLATQQPSGFDPDAYLAANEPEQPTAQQPAQPRKSMVDRVNEKMRGQFVPPAVGSDFPASQAAIEARNKPEPTMGEKAIGVGETALTMGTGATSGTAGMIYGTLKGLADTVTGGDYGTLEGAKNVQDMANKYAAEYTYAPRTETGQEYVANTVEAVAPLAAVAPLSGEITAAANAARTVMPKFKFQTPFKRSLTEDLKRASAQPELGGSIKALAQSVKEGKIKPEALPVIIKGMEDEIVSKSGKGVFKQVAQIADDIKAGNADAINTLAQSADDIGRVSQGEKLAKYMLTGQGEAQKNTYFGAAEKQGFDPGTLQIIQGSTKADKQRFLEMTRVMKRGLDDPRYRIENRPITVAAKSLLKRIEENKKINKQAADQLDDVARGLKGRNVDVNAPIESFLNELDDMGITFDDNLKPNFANSDISGKNLRPLQNAIDEMVTKVKPHYGFDNADGITSKKTDAYLIHRLKRQIDENVNFGEAGTGLKGNTERIFKNLRRGLDEQLDNNFDDYNQVNTRYSETRDVLNDLQDTIGKKIKLDKGYSAEILGNKLTGMTNKSNYGSKLKQNIKDLEAIGRKYGAEFDDDVVSQAMYAQELDQVFEPAVRGSMEGIQTRAAMKGAEAISKGPVGAAVDLTKAGAKRVIEGKKDRESAFKAIEGFINKASE